MKKLYSIVLMAVALLVSTNMWAGTYNVGTTSEFETAWGKSATEDVVINLTSANVQLTKTMWLGTQAINGTAHSVEINLNGYPLTSSAATAFLLTHGTLEFSGNGQVTGNGNGEMIYITGSTNKDVDPSKSVAENNGKPYFTHLIVGEGVIIANTQYKAAISIDGVRKSSSNIAYAANANFIPNKSALSYITNVYAKKADASAKYASHGVRLDIHGTVNGTKYGIKSNGDLGNPNYYFTSSYKKEDNTVAFTDDLLPAGYVIAANDVNYAPFIYIHRTARITANATKGDASKSPVALYASGFARWKVEGFVSGSVGALVKSGDVDFENATVEGTGESYAASTPTSSGTTACGSAIAMESNTAYAGDINVTIGGDSKVTATNGYAIDENVVTSDNATKVDAITITGGTFQGGTVPDPQHPGSNMEGVMNVSQPTAIANQDPNEETTITIIGGSASQGSATIGDQTLADYLADATTEQEQGKTHITFVDNGQGGTVMVISQGEAPDATEAPVSSWSNGDAIDWKHASPTDDDPMSGVIASDLTLDELQMTQSYNQTLTVNDGVTFTVDRVLMGSHAKIIVEAGGTFIVKGTQGITAPVVDNIVLKHNSNTGKYATFLFNPAVTSNRHPNATVEFTTNAWRESSTALQWEWFGIPTYNLAKSISSTGYANVAVYENAGWTNLGYIGLEYDNNPAVLAKLDKPFAAYDLLAYRDHDAAAPEISISGELVGNMNAPLNANLHWSPFANSYTAEVDAVAFINSLTGSSNITDAIYVATQNANGTIKWDVRPAAKAAALGLKLKPMQAFLLNNPNFVEEATINYASMVYAPAVPGYTPAPRRSMAAPYSAQITINVANADGILDDVDVLEGTEAKSYEKFLNSDVNIYVADGEKNDYIVAEDLEGTYVGFSTVNGGNFTISFDGVQGNEFMLVDHATGAEVLMVEGNTYEFTADANSANDYRFEIVSPRKVTTAIENAEAVKSAKGIYTITGQYMGEMNVWNSLPAGVYVVNGEKRVK